MNETNFTPGPWGCSDTSYHAHDYRLTKPDGSHLPVNAPYNDHSEQRANARLIALAPAMLAALKQVSFYARINHGTKCKDYGEVVDDVLNKIGVPTGEL